eukprot:1312799-Rhodomonas_salina.1
MNLPNPCVAYNNADDDVKETFIFPNDNLYPFLICTIASFASAPISTCPTTPQIIDPFNLFPQEAIYKVFTFLMFAHYSAYANIIVPFFGNTTNANPTLIWNAHNIVLVNTHQDPNYTTLQQVVSTYTFELEYNNWVKNSRYRFTNYLYKTNHATTKHPPHSSRKHKRAGFIHIKQCDAKKHTLHWIHIVKPQKQSDGVT